MKLTCAVAILTLLSASLVASAEPASALLGRRVPLIHFEETSLADALTQFQETTGANFSIDWPAIEESGLGKATPVTLRLRNVRMSLALKKTLDSAGAGLLTYYVHQNVITVTSVAKADTQMVTIVYPVADLLAETPDFRGPEMSLDQNVGRRSRGGEGGQGTGLFGGSNADAGRDEDRPRRADRVADLIELIQATIRPEIWDVNGGKASIRYLNGNLIITAPRTVQGGF